MRTDGTDAYLEWTAAYVLGSLDPHERRELEKHLVECSNCAAAVSEFAALPALLSTLSEDKALALGRSGTAHVPPELLRTLGTRSGDDGDGQQPDAGNSSPDQKTRDQPGAMEDVGLSPRP